MPVSLEHIKQLLKDPFFEMRYFGKEAVRQRILPLEKYGASPANFQFVDWQPKDNYTLIEYSLHDSAIGKILIASTQKGLCFLGFASHNETSLKSDFIQRFPTNPIEKRTNNFHKLALEFCDGNYNLAVPLHMKGTGFQLEIWKKLVRIPTGRLSTYGSLAPNAGGAQAVGAAVGSNPVSYIVPCHRVVKSDGKIEGYHWGTEIKKELLAYEFLL